MPTSYEHKKINLEEAESRFTSELLSIVKRRGRKKIQNIRGSTAGIWEKGPRKITSSFKRQKDGSYKMRFGYGADNSEREYAYGEVVYNPIYQIIFESAAYALSNSGDDSSVRKTEIAAGEFEDLLVSSLAALGFRDKRESFDDFLGDEPETLSDDVSYDEHATSSAWENARKKVLKSVTN